jgi:hypothetical protein
MSKRGFDGNSVARRLFGQDRAAKQARDAFTEAARIGLVHAVDRLGRRLEPGDLVLLHSELDLIFQVASITPILDPKHPSGYVRLLCRAEVPITMPAGSPFARVVWVPSMPVPGNMAGAGSAADDVAETPGPSDPDETP